MLQNLGAYTVKDIQVYDKRDRLSELAGAQIGKSSYVMDVKMKKEFMGGTMINAEAGCSPCCSPLRGNTPFTSTPTT